MKKGQIAIFMILGVIIVASLILVFLLSNPLTIRGAFSSSAQTLADTCFTSSEVCMLHQLGNTGGNLEFSKKFPTLLDSKDNGEYYFGEAAKICQEDFRELNGESVESSEISADILFNLKDTTVKTDQKIIVKKGGSTKEINDFVTKIPVRYESCYMLANNLKNHQLSKIDNSYINANLLEDPNIDANVYEGKENVIVLTDRESRIEDTKYKFTFIK